MQTLTSEGVADPARIFLLGFSQSCALNYRFAFTYPDRLRGVIGICGGLPGDWETSALYQPTKAAVFHLLEHVTSFIRPRALRIMKSDCDCGRLRSSSRVMTLGMKWCRRCGRMSERG